MPIVLKMSWEILESVGLWLALLGALLVNGVWAILAAQRRHALEIHDRIRASKELRVQYLNAVERK